MTNLVLGAGGAAAAYTVDQSLRFEDSTLNRTPASAGNRKTYTVSVWVKRSELGATYPGVFSGGTGSDLDMMRFQTSGELAYRAGASYEVASTALYRDVGAWYHLLMAVDTNESTSTDRVKLYVNGDVITAFSATTYPAEDFEGSINNTVIHYIGTGDNDAPTTRLFNGYLAEFYVIDGQALTPSSFGETDSATNQWKPIDASGLTFGTNGFYQKYAATTLANSFTDSSEDIFTPTESLSVDYLVVAGGGGGGNAGANTGYWGAGGGAGAGGYLTGTGHSVTAKDYTITVGDGGAGAGYQVAENGTTGSDSIFDTYTAVGGGSGASGIINSLGGDGGSGGGGSYGARASGSGTAGQGYDGGDNSYTSSGSSGGGGGAQGGDAGATVGAGGTGISNNYRDGTSGTTIGTNYFAGGGGGGSHNGTAASATYGGGAGGIRGGTVNGTSNGVAGTTTSGGGGGGGSNSSSDSLTTGGAGGDGGSGIVVIRYISTTEKATGGTITSYVDGSDTYQVHTFTHVIHTITANGDVANTRAQSKVGDSSIYFDGTGDYLSMPDSSDWDFGSGNFTIEFWTRLSSSDDDIRFIGQKADDNNYWKVEKRASDDTAGEMHLRWHASGSDEFSEYGSALSWSDNTWYHMAVVRNGSSWVVYRDGTSVMSFTYSSAVSDIASTLLIGQLSGGAYLDGYMDEIRISDTARYTTTFTPQTTEFTSDSNTLLLIHSNWDGGLGADSSGNYNTFSVTNLVATDQMVDSPTNNFATLNPLSDPSCDVTLSEGNLKATAVDNNCGKLGTIPYPTSGKWYYEGYVESIPGTDALYIGICEADFVNAATGAITYYQDGRKYDESGNLSAYGDGYGVGDIIGVVMNMDDDEFGCAGSPLLQGLFSSCSKQGLLSSCSARASRCFSCCGTRALGRVGSVVEAQGLSCSASCGIFWIGD